jgi:uncharacterized protein HemY
MILENFAMDLVRLLILGLIVLAASYGLFLLLRTLIRIDKKLQKIIENLESNEK